MTDFSKFEKYYGKGCIRVGSSVEMPTIVPTGIKRLDYSILKIGGFPLGRVIEIAGRPSAGKSSFAMNFVASAQKNGYSCAWIDNEGQSYTTKWAKDIGADTDKLMLMDVAGLDGDSLLERVHALIALADPPINVIVLDSIANIRAKEQTSVTISNETMYTDQSKAKLLTSFFQQLHGGFTLKEKGSGVLKLEDFPTCLIIVNHLKDRISLNGITRRESIGGEALKFAATIRLFFDRLGTDKEDRSLARIRIHCEKHKLAVPYGNGEFLFNLKTCQFEEDYKFLLETALNIGLITGGGAGYYKISSTEEKFRGIEPFIQKCKQEPEFLNQIIKIFEE